MCGTRTIKKKIDKFCKLIYYGAKSAVESGDRESIFLGEKIKDVLGVSCSRVKTAQFKEFVLTDEELSYLDRHDFLDWFRYYGRGMKSFVIADMPKYNTEITIMNIVKFYTIYTSKKDENKMQRLVDNGMFVKSEFGTFHPTIKFNRLGEVNKGKWLDRLKEIGRDGL